MQLNLERPDYRYFLRGADGASALVNERRIERSFVVAPDVPAHDPTLAAIRWSADREGRIGSCVLGPHPIVPTLIEAGFRIVDRDTFQASDQDLVDPERLLPNTGFL